MRACDAMRPRLEAEESLRAANEVSLGSGALKKADARALQRQWMRAAQARRGRAHVPSLDDIASMGIKVVRVKRQVTTDGDTAHRESHS